MKICIAIPCLLVGGTEIQSLNLLKALIIQGHDVEILCYHEYNIQTVSEYKYYGAKVTLLMLQRSINKFSLLKILRNNYKKNAPNLIFVQYIAPAAISILAARLAGINNVVGVMHQLGTSQGFMNHLLFNLASKLCTKMIFVSASVQKSWNKSPHYYTNNIANSFKNKNGVIYNAVDIKFINEIRSKKKISIDKPIEIQDKKLVVGVVSRLREEKGIDILLTALNLIGNNKDKFKVIIIGNGPDKDDLINLSKIFELDNIITWLGELPWTNMIQEMFQMDIIVIPSRLEGFGLTAIEALACGKPVLAAKIGGLQEIIIHNQNGFFFESNNAYDLAEVLLTLHQKIERLEQSEALIEYAKNKFSFEIYSETLKTFVDSLE